MSTEYEVRLDGGRTLLVGEARVNDTSFDHAHGTEPVLIVDVIEFKVYVCVDGQQEDITTSLSTPTYNRLLDKFEESVYAQIQLQKLEES